VLLARLVLLELVLVQIRSLFLYHRRLQVLQTI